MHIGDVDVRGVEGVVDVPFHLVLVNKAEPPVGALVWKLLASVNTVAL